MRRTLAALALVLGLAGCATGFTVGAPPPTERLSRLTAGTSTRDDVRQALGEPRGAGMARSSTLGDARRIWLYDHHRGGDGKAAMTILIVFFRDDRYDGHLWFSSARLLEVER